MILFLVCAFSSINLFGFDYGGFSIDDEIIKDKSKQQQHTVQASLKNQIDIINTISITPEILDFFTTSQSN